MKQQPVTIETILRKMKVLFPKHDPLSILAFIVEMAERNPDIIEDLKFEYDEAQSVQAD